MNAKKNPLLTLLVISMLVACAIGCSAAQSHAGTNGAQETFAFEDHASDLPFEDALHSTYAALIAQSIGVLVEPAEVAVSLRPDYTVCEIAIEKPDLSPEEQEAIRTLVYTALQEEIAREELALTILTAQQ